MMGDELTAQADRLRALTDHQFSEQFGTVIAERQDLGEWAVPWMNEIFRRFVVNNRSN